MPMPKKKSSWKDILFGHVLALVFCVGFPGFVTAVAPVSWVTFERHGEKVSARARICMFFVVPYLIKTVDPVVGIDDRFVQGTVTRSRSDKQGNRSEDEGFLVIHGTDHTIEVPVTPFNVDSVTQRAEEFLTNSQANRLSMVVVANWKFSVFAGGLVCLLTLLYLFGILLGLWRGLLWLLSFLC
jgi:hypothetical protein